MNAEDPVSVLPLVGPSYTQKLKKLNIETIEDLLLHVPNRYLDFRKTKKIASLTEGDIVTTKGTIKSIINQFTKGGKKIQIAQLTDDTGSITVVWFNQPFLIRTIHPGTKMSLAGEVGWFGRQKALVSPEYEIKRSDGRSIHTGSLIPIYPLTSGVSSKWLRGRIKVAYDVTKSSIKDFLPHKILKKEKLPPLDKSFRYVHSPKDITEAKVGHERLAFNELLFFNILSLDRKRKWLKNETVHKLKVNEKEINSFINSFPFKLTGAQERTVHTILKDLQKDIPMNRLLEGDVGSGKTVVAAVMSFVCFLNGNQSVIMAPTQILAKQHYQTLKEVFKKYKVRITLATSSGVVSDVGKADIIVGTHSLLHKRVDFENVAGIVIDEQHRFGVKQRAYLISESKTKKKAPHVLTMTATPIPRSIALTAYGDLDLSVLDELPKGRKKITTWIVPPSKREGAYDWIVKRIDEDDIQVFVICPLIEESASEGMSQVKAATIVHKELKEVFLNHKVGLLHGRLKDKEKDKVLSDFKKKKIDILVSTPVVEVGIDIPNANIMLIEGADRFGLAQLHQLRGRVGRSDKKAYCLLFSESKSKKVTKRLSALRRESSGFTLAEIDLKMRGPGEIFGIKQHGFPELKVASWQDIDLIKRTRVIAEDILDKPDNYKLLFDKMKKIAIPRN
jgi:ATP-dependent DNA helicase RecG